MAQTLSKHEILRGYGSFTRVLHRGTTLSRPPVRLFYRYEKDPGPAVRVGFSVARSFRTAARRNKARRILREAYRLRERTIPHNPGRGRLEIVLMYTGAPGVPPRLKEVERSLQRLFEDMART